MSLKGDLAMKAREGNLPSIQEALISNSQLINERDEDLRTLLLWAVSGKQLDLVQYLLGKGADAQVIDEAGWSALHIAASVGSLELVKLLATTYPGLVNLQNEKGQTALFYAASKNYLHVGQFLIDHEADVNIQDELGQTAIYRSIAHSHSQFTHMLLAHSARTKLFDKLGNTPLHIACEENFIDMAKVLIEKGCDPDRLNKKGESPLDLAESKKRKELLTFIESL